MKKLNKEINERIKYLEEQEQTEDIKSRLNEIRLFAFRVQQIILSDLNRKNEDIIVSKSKLKRAYTDILFDKLKTDMSIEWVVNDLKKTTIPDLWFNEWFEKNHK